MSSYAFSGSGNIWVGRVRRKRATLGALGRTHPSYSIHVSEPCPDDRTMGGSSLLHSSTRKLIDRIVVTKEQGLERPRISRAGAESKVDGSSWSGVSGNPVSSSFTSTHTKRDLHPVHLNDSKILKSNTSLVTSCCALYTKKKWSKGNKKGPQVRPVATMDDSGDGEAPAAEQHRSSCSAEGTIIPVETDQLEKGPGWSTPCSSSVATTHVRRETVRDIRTHVSMDRGGGLCARRCPSPKDREQPRVVGMDHVRKKTTACSFSKDVVDEPSSEEPSARKEVATVSTHDGGAAPTTSVPVESGGIVALSELVARSDSGSPPQGASRDVDRQSTHTGPIEVTPCSSATSSLMGSSTRGRIQVPTDTPEVAVRVRDCDDPKRRHRRSAAHLLSEVVEDARCSLVRLTMTEDDPMEWNNRCPASLLTTSGSEPPSRNATSPSHVWWQATHPQGQSPAPTTVREGAVPSHPCSLFGRTAEHTPLRTSSAFAYSPPPLSPLVVRPSGAMQPAMQGAADRVFPCLVFLGGPVLFTAPHAKEVWRDGEHSAVKGVSGRRLHKRELYTSELALHLTQSFFRVTPQIGASFIVWNIRALRCNPPEEINAEPDPNYLFQRERGESAWHRALLAFHVRWGGLPLLHIDIHGKKDRRDNLFMDVGLSALRAYNEACYHRVREHLSSHLPPVLGLLPPQRSGKAYGLNFPSFGERGCGFWGPSAGGTEAPYTMAHQSSELGIIAMQLEIPKTVRCLFLQHPHVFDRIVAVLQEMYFLLPTPKRRQPKTEEESCPLPNLSFSSSSSGVQSPVVPLHASRTALHRVANDWPVDNMHHELLSEDPIACTRTPDHERHGPKRSFADSTVLNETQGDASLGGDAPADMLRRERYGSSYPQWDMRSADVPTISTREYTACAAHLLSELSLIGAYDTSKPI